MSIFEWNCSSVYQHNFIDVSGVVFFYTYEDVAYNHGSYTIKMYNPNANIPFCPLASRTTLYVCIGQHIRREMKLYET